MNKPIEPNPRRATFRCDLHRITLTVVADEGHLMDIQAENCGLTYWFNRIMPVGNPSARVLEATHGPCCRAMKFSWE